jgi:hypothetical protein
VALDKERPYWTDWPLGLLLDKLQRAAIFGPACNSWGNRAWETEPGE